MEQKRKDLLYNLKHNTYCRLAPSKIHGVGVFAVKNIPKGVNPFKMTANREIKYNSIKLSKDDIDQLDKNVKKIVTDFITLTGCTEGTSSKNYYYIPYLGMNCIDMSFYMNHSDKNNVIVNSKGTNPNYDSFVTARAIRQGEELTINYHDYELLE